MNNTTDLNGTDTEETVDDHAVFMEYKVAVVIWTVVPPILIVLGTAGNFMSVIVLSRSSMRQSTSSLYLRALAFVDMLVLWTGLLRGWLLHIIETDVRHLSEAGCKIHTWILYFSVHTSAWLLVAVTVERALSVMFPHMIKLKCTRKVAYSLNATIIIFFLLLNAHYLYGIGDYLDTSESEPIIIPCDGITDEYYLFERRVWVWIDFCVYSAFPSTILVICNFLIIRKVFRSDKKVAGAQGYSGSVSARRSKTASMTLSLVVVSATFVVCTTPFCTYAIYTNTQNVQSVGYHRAVESLLWAVVNMLQYCNNAINFILYSLTGSRFRSEVKSLFCKRSGLAPKPTIYTTVTGPMSG